MSSSHAGNVTCDYHAREILIYTIEAYNEVKYIHWKCDHQATMKGNLTHHQSTVHESVKYPSRQYDHQAILNAHLVKHQKALHKVIQ